MRVIADQDHGRDNNYHLLRLIGALLVIVGHSYYLSTTSGAREPLKLLTGYKHFGEVGVQMFFVISGFLVTKSFVSRADLASYAEARILRIFPALIVAVVFGVLIIGPLATTLALGDYWGNRDIYRHLLTNVTLYAPHLTLPGTFAANPWKTTVNGSLWTLFIEVRLYLLVAMLGVLGLLVSRRRFNTVLVTLVALCVYFPGVPRILDLAVGNLDYQLASYFLFGVICYFNRDKVPIHWGIAVVLVGAAVLAHGTRSFPVAFDVAVSYGTLFLAYTPSPEYIRRFNNDTGDYSYGLYLYAFPVQQMIAFLIPNVTALPMMVLAVAVTLPLAMGSWHMIEKPALATRGKLAAKLVEGGRQLLVSFSTGKRGPVVVRPADIPQRSGVNDPGGESR